MAAPAIQNARKKLEIIERHLRRLNTSLNPEIVVGLDLGTGYSGVSWAVNDGFDHIRHISDWPSHTGLVDSIKVPSKISYQNGSPCGWGFTALEGDETVTCFDVMLDSDTYSKHAHELKTIGSSIDLVTKLGKRKEQVMIDYIALLWHHAQNSIQKCLGEFEYTRCSMRVIVGAPGDSTVSSKDHILSIVERAGLPNDVRLVTEAEAAALSTEKGPSSMSSSHDGDIVVICDAGHITVGVTTFKIVSSEPLRLYEYARPSGGLCGSVVIDEAFEQYVEQAIGQEAYWQIPARTRRRILRDFNEGIKLRYSGESQEYSIGLHGTHDDKARGIEDNEITVKAPVLKACFDHAIDKILSLVRDQIHSVKQQGDVVNAIYLVGGFGANKYLYERLKALCETECTEVIRPKDAWLAVCKGAVMSGLENADRFPINTAKHSFGICLTSPLAATADEATWLPSDGLRNSGRMDWLVRKGDHIEPGQAIEKQLNIDVQVGLADRGNRDFSETLFYCADAWPPTSREASVKELCTIQFSIDCGRLWREQRWRSPSYAQGWRPTTFTLTLRLSRATPDISITYQGISLSSKVVYKDNTLSKSNNEHSNIVTGAKEVETAVTTSDQVVKSTVVSVDHSVAVKQALYDCIDSNARLKSTLAGFPGDIQRTIFATISRVCLGTFAQLHELLAIEGTNSEVLIPLSPSAVHREFDRFKVWCGNLAALAIGRSSLDARLRESTVMRESMLKDLARLYQVLAKCYDIVSGKRKPFENAPASDVSEDSTDSDETASSVEDEVPPHELSVLLSSIKDILNSLYKLSYHIRNASTRDTTRSMLHAEVDDDTGIDLFDCYINIDRGHIKELLVQMRRESGALAPQQLELNISFSGQDRVLTERLVTTMNYRRRMLRYWRRHAQKMTQAQQMTELNAQELPEPAQVGSTVDKAPAAAKDIGRTALPVQAPGLAAGTILSMTDATFFTHRIDEQVDMQSIVSYVSAATDASNEQGTLPPPPRPDLGSSEFMCSYCAIVCPVRQGHGTGWIKHIIQDLRPYICTYTECKNGNQFYGSRTAWLDHEQQAHRNVWQCFRHADLRFPSKDALRQHLRAEHHDEVDDAVIHSLLDAARLSTAEVRQQCPFCLAVAPFSNGLDSHMAHHMHMFARFCVPRSTDEDDDTGSDIADEDSRDARGLRSDQSQLDASLVFESDPSSISTNSTKSLQSASHEGPSPDVTSRKSKAAASSEAQSTTTESTSMVIIMGAAGAGKSYFVNRAAGSNIVMESHSMASGTENCQLVAITLGHTKLLLLDTPSFDDPTLGDSEVLENLARVLAAQYELAVPLKGIIYLHRISDHRYSGSQRRMVELLMNICGEEQLKDIFLVTTMWHQVDEDIGADREMELRGTFWRRMIERGATMDRFRGDRGSAIALLTRVMTRDNLVLQLQRELVDEGKALVETAAGRSLHNSLMLQTGQSTDMK